MRTRRKRRLAQGDDAATIAQTFVFSNGVVAQGWAGGSCCGLRPSSAGGAWLGLRRCPTGPPSNVIGNRGTPPVPPAGAAPPARCLGNGNLLLLAPSFSGGLAWRAPLSHRPTLQRYWVQGDSPCTPGGGCAPCTLLGGRRSFALWPGRPFLTFPRGYRGRDRGAPSNGGAPRRPAWGDGRP